MVLPENKYVYPEKSDKLSDHGTVKQVMLNRFKYVHVVEFNLMIQ